MKYQIDNMMTCLNAVEVGAFRLWALQDFPTGHLFGPRTAPWVVIVYFQGCPMFGGDFQTKDEAQDYIDALVAMAAINESAEFEASFSVAFDRSMSRLGQFQGIHVPRYRFDRLKEAVAAQAVIDRAAA